MEVYLVTINFLSCLMISESAKILAVFPMPSISHQIVFRPYTEELARRGHEVVVITTDPAFQKGETPENLTEIDIHDISYNTWMRVALKHFEEYQASGTVLTGKKNFFKSFQVLLDTFLEVFEAQIMNSEFQKVLNNIKDIDLLILEPCHQPFIILSHFYKVPVIMFSSFGNFPKDFDIMGAPIYPLLYSSPFRTRIYNLSYLEKLSELYMYYSIKWFQSEYEEKQNKVFKRLFGPATPSVKELTNNVGMMFLNVHPIWEGNWPVPPSVIHVGGIHAYEIKPKPLPNDMQLFLNASANGVVYVSFGTNVSPSTIHPDKKQVLLNVFSKLPYGVLWKWDENDFHEKKDNIRIANWFPQADILKHPNIKVFITQGGLQSTDEAILAGVPMIGIPMLADQWFNTENYELHKIGIQLDMDELTENKLESAITTIIEDESYHANVLRLQRLMQDQPQSPLQRAIWWTEHVLRYGTDHLRAPTANISWTEYYNIGLLSGLLISFLIIVCILVYSIKTLILTVLKLFPKYNYSDTKLKCK